MTLEFFHIRRILAFSSLLYIQNIGLKRSKMPTTDIKHCLFPQSKPWEKIKSKRDSAIFSEKLPINYELFIGGEINICIIFHIPNTITMSMITNTQYAHKPFRYFYLFIIISFYGSSSSSHITRFSAEDYCKVSNKHTMCKYKAQNQTGKCSSPVKTRTLTDAEKKEIVDYHNVKRTTIAMRGQPGLGSIANMNKLVHTSIDVAKKKREKLFLKQ